MNNYIHVFSMFSKFYWNKSNAFFKKKSWKRSKKWNADLKVILTFYFCKNIKDLKLGRMTTQKCKFDTVE